MRKALLVLLLLVIVLLVFFAGATPAGGSSGDAAGVPDRIKIQLCSPGFPSGWWRSECYGPDGGWALLSK